MPDVVRKNALLWMKARGGAEKLNQAIIDTWGSLRDVELKALREAHKDLADLINAELRS